MLLSGPGMELRQSPDTRPIVVLWVVALAVFLFGHAWFYKLRKTFADVI